MTLSSGAGPPRTVAHLVYDTKAQPLVSGVRAVQQRARRLLYTLDETEVVLQIAPGRQAEHVRLTGQVLTEGAPVEGAAISLQGLSRLGYVTDEEGEFRVMELPTGSYSLDIGTAAAVIGIAALDLD